MTSRSDDELSAAFVGPSGDGGHQCEHDLALVLIGSPGGGKGTQAASLRDEFALEHIATGDLLREHRARETDLGRRASEYMSAGALVPDAMVLSMIKERLAVSRRFLLDGFPRTLSQAHSLSLSLSASERTLSGVIYLDVSDEVVIDRIEGRLHCAGGHVFHRRYRPPEREGICDFDGQPLAQRDDDRTDTIRRRLAVFHRQTAPVVRYYADLGLLHRLDGARPVDEVHALARQILIELTRCSRR